MNLLQGSNGGLRRIGSWLHAKDFGQIKGEAMFRQAIAGRFC